MTWTSLSNLAVFAVCAALTAAIVYTLTGLDRWLDDRRYRRESRSRSSFFSGEWADVWEAE